MGEAERAIRRRCSHDEFAEIAFSALDATTVRDAVTANIELLRAEPFHYPALLHGPAGALPGFVVLGHEGYVISLYTVNPRRLRQLNARLSSPFSEHEGRTIRFDTKSHSMRVVQGCIELTAWRLSEPSGGDPITAASAATNLAYGYPHDHNFSFLTSGYLGPGYVSDYYEYDYSSCDPPVRSVQSGS